MFNLLQQLRNRNRENSKTGRYFCCLHDPDMSVIPKSPEPAQEEKNVSQPVVESIISTLLPQSELKLK